MILNDNEVETRLISPNNLLNRLKKITSKNTGMEIFVPQGNDESSAVFDKSNDDVVVSDLDNIDKLVEDHAKKIKMGIIKQRALDVLHDSLGELGNRISEVAKVRDLATIAKDMNNILTAEDSKKNNIGQQVIVYKPIVNDISKYETLVVNE